MDHRRILWWAEQSLGRLEEVVKEFVSKHPAVLVTKHDPTTDEYVVSLKVRRMAVQDEWTFLIGDTLHNMRVALDYLTFKIVNPDPSDERLVRATQFPIAKAKSDWANLQRSRIGTLSPSIQAVFESLQPYHALNSPRLEPLAVLNALENVHKHRFLLDAYPSVTSLGFVGDRHKVGINYTNVPFGPVEDGKELWRYTFVDPAEKWDLQFRIRTHVCFDRNGPAQGQMVVTALREIRDHIKHTVFPALEPYI